MRAVLVPYNDEANVRVFNYREVEELNHLIHSNTPVGQSRYLDFKTFPFHGVQLAYDDMGLYQQPLNINRRAMKLWAHLAGMTVQDFTQNLVGDFVVIGVTDWGDYADVSEEMVTTISTIGDH